MSAGLQFLSEYAVVGHLRLNHCKLMLHRYSCCCIQNVNDSLVFITNELNTMKFIRGILQLIFSFSLAQNEQHFRRYCNLKKKKNN